MKKAINVFLYLLLSVTFVTMTGCSKDDPFEDNPNPIQPEKPGGNEDPGSDLPDKSDLSKEILGEWSKSETELGGLVYVTSTNLMTFGSSNSFTITWFEAVKTDKPYTTAKGKYTIKGDSLKLEWDTVTTDSILNAAFNTFCISGKCEITDNTINYSYSVLDSNGDKLSGPHSTKFAKQ